MSSTLDTSRAAKGRLPASLELGAAVRQARVTAGLTLHAVAVEAGTSVPTLQAIETGARSVPTQLLVAIARATNADDSSLFSAAGSLPDGVVAELLSPEFAAVVQQGSLTREARAALRRTHLAARAQELTASVSAGAPVDIEGLLFKTLGVDFRASTDGSVHAYFETPDLFCYPQSLDGDGLRLERRFVFAHMAGHVILGREADAVPRCRPGRQGEDEAEASWLAGRLLLPRPLLVGAFQAVVGRYDVHDPESFGLLLADLARRCDVPAWLAARQLPEVGQILWAAGEADL